MNDDDIEPLLFSVRDPKYNFQGRPVPALTSLMYRVCGDDPERFEEATRILQLFIDATRSEAQAHHPVYDPEES